MMVVGCGWWVGCPALWPGASCTVEHDGGGTRTNAPLASQPHPSLTPAREGARVERIHTATTQEDEEEEGWCGLKPDGDVAHPHLHPSLPNKRYGAGVPVGAEWCVCGGGGTDASRHGREVGGAAQRPGFSPSGIG